MRSRLAWTVLDQILTSATAFVVSVVAARQLAPDDFGQFSLWLTIYFLSQVVFRAALAEPLLVRYAGSEPTTLSTGLAIGRGAAIMTAVGMTLGLTLSIFVSGGLSDIWWLGGSVGCLLLCDFMRFSFIAEGKPRTAAIGSLLLLGITTGSLFLAIQFTIDVPVKFIGAWGIAAFVTCAVMAAVTRMPIAVGAGRLWFREHHILIRGHVADALLGTGTRQIAALVVAGAGGLVTAGALRGAQMAMGPLTMLDLALGTLVLSEGTRLNRTRPDRLVPFTIAASTALAICAITFGALVEKSPDHIGAMFLGESWGMAREVIVPMSCLVAVNAVLLGAGAGLRVIQASQLSAQLRLRTAPAVIVAAFAGVSVAGARGTIIAQTVVLGVAAAISWRLFLSAHQTGPLLNSIAGRSSVGSEPC